MNKYNVNGQAINNHSEAMRATSHTRLRACDHYTSSTLVGGEGGAGPSLLHTTLRGQRSIWMARWMWSLHRFLHIIEWIMFHGHLDYSQKSLFGDRYSTKLGDHGTPNAHNCWYILFYHVWGPAWIKKIIEIAVGWGPGYIWLHTTLNVHDHTTWFWKCLGTAFGHFLLGSYNFMGTALGSCVKWPLNDRLAGGLWPKPYDVFIYI